MKIKFALALLLLGAVAAPAVAVSDVTVMPLPRGPATGRTPAALVPAGWHLLAAAEGDLNGDGHPDAAIVLSSPLEDGADPGKWVARWLVLAVRDRAGVLHRNAISSAAVLCEGCGGIKGDPFQGIEIQRRAVVLNHWGGSRFTWDMVDRFLLDAGIWYHVGITRGSTDTLADRHREHRDVNVATGLVIETVTREEDKRERTFRQLRVAPVHARPDSAAAAPWPSLPLALGPDDVVSGPTGFHGPTDLKARLEAVTQGGALYLRATVVDDRTTPDDAVRLVDGRGRVIAPRGSRIRPRADGYQVVARYALTDLGTALPPPGPSPAPGADRNLRLAVSVEVADYDGPTEALTVLSTSRGGRSYPGEIRLVARGGVPRLSELNRDTESEEVTWAPDDP